MLISDSSYGIPVVCQCQGESREHVLAVLRKSWTCKAYKMHDINTFIMYVAD